MSRRHSWKRLGLLIALASADGCNSRTPISPNVTIVGSATSKDNFAISGGNLMAHSGKPAVMFGTVTKPKCPTELSYVLLFKLPQASGGFSFNNEGEARGLSTGGGKVKNAYTINGKRLEAAALFELNADRTLVEKETLTIGGKEVDPAAGRLFLVDLTAVPPAYQQKKIALPAEVPPHTKEADVERFAEALLKTLQENNPEVEEWLK